MNIALRPSWILIAGIIAGFILGGVGQGILICTSNFSTQNCPSALDILVQQNSMVVYNQSYWQLFTSIFVTNSPLDALLNSIAVFVLDIFLGFAFNKTRYFGVFFATAFAGNILTLLAGPGYASAGASGGIFGLYAAAFSFNWAEAKKLDYPTLSIFLIIFLGSSFLVSGVNWLAHLGGAIGGLVAGPLLYLSMRERLASFQNISNSLAFTKLLVAILIFLAILGSLVQFIFFVFG